MTRLVLDGLRKTFNGVAAVHHLDLATAEGEFISLLGPERLRQDDDAALRRRLRISGCRAGAARRRGSHRPAARAPRHRHGVPELRAVPAPDGPAQPGLRPGDARHRQGRDPPAGRRGAGHGAAERACWIAIRGSSPAASSSGWRSPGRWSSSRGCCCSTSRWPTSMRCCATRCGSSSANCRSASASPPST